MFKLLAIRPPNNHPLSESDVEIPKKILKDFDTESIKQWYSDFFSFPEKMSVNQLTKIKEKGFCVNLEGNQLVPPESEAKSVLTILSGIICGVCSDIYDDLGESKKHEDINEIWEKLGIILP